MLTPEVSKTENELDTDQFLLSKSCSEQSSGSPKSTSEQMQTSADTHYPKSTNHDVADGSETHSTKHSNLAKQVGTAADSVREEPVANEHDDYFKIYMDMSDDDLPPPDMEYAFTDDELMSDKEEDIGNFIAGIKKQSTAESNSEFQSSQDMKQTSKDKLDLVTGHLPLANNASIDHCKPSFTKSKPVSDHVDDRAKKIIVIDDNRRKPSQPSLSSDSDESVDKRSRSMRCSFVIQRHGVWK